MWRIILLCLVCVSAFGQTKALVYSITGESNTAPIVHIRASKVTTYGDGSTAGAIDLLSANGSTNWSFTINPSATASSQLIGPAAPFNGFWMVTNSSTTNMAIIAAHYTVTADALTDDTYSGIPLIGRVAGETLTQWDLVRYHTDGKWYKADADGASLPAYEAKGIAVAGAAADALVTILRTGTVRNDGWTWTAGGAVYLSTTAGAMTQTKNTTSTQMDQQVGWALTDDEVFFDFSFQSEVNP